MKNKYSTLSEHFKKYHTVGTLPKISHCRNISKNITLSEHYQKYHTVGTFQKISHCRNITKNSTLSEHFKLQKNRRTRQNTHKYNILAWCRYFNKKCRG